MGEAAVKRSSCRVIQPTLEAGTQLFVDERVGASPLHAGSVADARARLVRMQSQPVGKPSASFQDLVFPVGPTGAVKVRIVRPRDARTILPVIMHFHGGGWVLGDSRTHDRLIREIAVGSGAALVFVEYDRAPECRFPIAIEQAYAATRHVVDQAKGMNLDATRLAIIGDSAGGNMAAVVAYLAKARRGPKIDLQVLFYPVTDTNFDTASHRLFAKGPWLTRLTVEWFWNAYLPDVGMRRDIRATPLNATIDQLRNLPDTLIMVAENDVHRDEGEAYGRKLSDAGVRVTSVRYNGTIHDFVMLNALADTPAARGAIEQTICTLKAAFE